MSFWTGLSLTLVENQVKNLNQNSLYHELSNAKMEGISFGTTDMRRFRKITLDLEIQIIKRIKSKECLTSFETRQVTRHLVHCVLIH